MSGVPESVQQLMKNNPDMLGCESHVWEKHLVHHLTAAQDQTQQDQKELQDLQTQLLKLQLAKAKQDVNDKKKTKSEQAKVMVQTAQGGWDGDNGPAYPDLSPPPPWESNQYQRGRGVVKSGGDMPRGGPRGGSGRGAYRRNFACYTCGDPNHWAKVCPYNTKYQRGIPHMRGGRGNGPPYQQTPGGGASQFPVWHDYD